MNSDRSEPLFTKDSGRSFSVRVWGGVIGLIGIGVARLALAACPPNQLMNPFDPNCTQNITVGTVVGRISNLLLALAMPLCGIMVIIGGFQMMTAAGDPAKFSRGKKTFIYAAVGFVIVLFASSIVPLLKSILGG
jgi:hypothetical protein